MKGLVLAILLLLPTSASVAKSRIWFSPLSSVTADGTGATDFMRLFEPNSPWQEVENSTAVFKLYPYFVGRASDEDLKKVLDYLTKRRIAIALEARVLTTVKGCHMPSGDGGQATENLLERIKRLGGTVTYLAMDEPLKHGLAGEDSCKATVAMVVDDIVNNVRRFREIFPHLQVGDVEPIGTWRNAPTLLDDTLSFVDAYASRSREKLAFVHADVGWTLPWTEITHRLAKELHTRGVPFGMIYNGEDLAKTDEEWSSEAVDHFVKFEECEKWKPDDIIFQTWRPHPTKVLPERDPSSLAGVAYAYLHKKAC